MYTGRNHDGLHLRRWFLFYLGFMAGLTLLIWDVIYRTQVDNQVEQISWLLALYLFYMSLCCTFIPLPTAWLVLLMASPMVGLITCDNPVLQGFLTIVMVAGVGALGTAIANLNEYHIFTYLLRCGHVSQVRQTRMYLFASKWFTVSPFSLLTLMSFLPVPVDVVRWIAISHRYSRIRYSLASFGGRFVRYSLFSATAIFLEIGKWQILAIQAALVAIVLLRYGVKYLTRPRVSNLMESKLEKPVLESANI